MAGALTAWQNNSNADRKVNRYANAVVALENHMQWWDSLPPVDQNSLSNINRLVSVGEGIKLVCSRTLSSFVCLSRDCLCRRPR